jgi:hypothetical protein
MNGVLFKFQVSPVLPFSFGFSGLIDRSIGWTCGTARMAAPLPATSPAAPPVPHQLGQHLPGHSLLCRHDQCFDSLYVIYERSINL